MKKKCLFFDIDGTDVYKRQHLGDELPPHRNDRQLLLNHLLIQNLQHRVVKMFAFQQAVAFF